MSKATPQVATAMFAARYKTIAVSFFADEAQRWKDALGADDYELTLDTGKVVKSKPDDITNDPSVAANANAIVLAVPSFAHGEYFEKFEPYIQPGTVVACMPARSGGDRSRVLTRLCASIVRYFASKPHFTSRYALTCKLPSKATS